MKSTQHILHMQVVSSLFTTEVSTLVPLLLYVKVCVHIQYVHTVYTHTYMYVYV